MAGYRQFHTQFWKDEWVIELEPLERYLFTYLFTNDLSSISGIFKLPLRVIVNETGLEKDFILTSFAKFQAAEKILYKDGVMWLVNMMKFHKNASPHTMKKVQHDVDEIPDCEVKACYLYYQKTGEYHIDTVSIQLSESKSKSVIVSGSDTPTTTADTVSVEQVENVFSVYTSEIGLLTPKISEELKLAEQDYSPGWVIDAIHEAVRANVRKWNYISAILKRWQVDGRTGPPKKSNGKTLPETYTLQMPDYLEGTS